MPAQQDMHARAQEDLDRIDDDIEQLKATTSIFYGHTSHGGQIITGMEMIRKENDLYDFGSGPGRGVYVHWNNTAWSRLHTLSPEGMVAGDLDGSGADELIVDFGAGPLESAGATDLFVAKLESDGATERGARLVELLLGQQPAFDENFA